MRRRSYLRDMAPSDDELEAAKTAGSAAQNGATWGSGVGTVLGGGLGALGFLAGGPVGLMTTPLGASVGGGLGSAIGGTIGGAQADDAEEKLGDAQLERQKQIEDEQLYREALNRLLETG